MPPEIHTISMPHTPHGYRMDSQALAPAIALCGELEHFPTAHVLSVLLRDLPGVTAGARFPFVWADAIHRVECALMMSQAVAGGRGPEAATALG